MREISGIIAAVRLRELDVPFVMLERNQEVGGVWLTNTYPGAGVDTPSYLNSFSFFPRHWSTHFAKRDEMATYLAAAVDHFDLRRHIIFGTEVDSAVYDEATRRGRVSSRDSDGSPRAVSANIVISAVGLFNKPKIPDIVGMDRFAGPMFTLRAGPRTSTSRASAWPSSEPEPARCRSCRRSRGKSRR